MTRPYSVRTALLMFVLLPLLGISALGGWLSLRALERQIEARMQEDIALIARTLRMPLSHALEHDRKGSVARALKSAFHIGRVYGAYVYDADGRQIAATGPRSPTDSNKAARLASSGNQRGQFERVDGHAVYAYFVPLTDSGGRIDGLLEVTRQGSDFQHYIRTVRYEGLALLIVTAAVLSTIILYGHHRAIGGHVTAVITAMGRITRGERGHRVPRSGPRELHALATGVNTMLDSLARHERALAEQRAAQAALENRLRQSEKMAAVGRLASGVAHELGTPLNVIDGTAQRALRCQAPEPVRGALMDIRREVERMGVTVRQLMDFGRNNALTCRAHPADRLIRGVLLRLEGWARSRGIALDLAPDGAVPVMMVDRVRLEQALGNLVRNAIQAARGRIQIGWFETTAAHGFTVEDDGEGVPVEQRSRIFEPFFTTKAVNEGTGLGLAVAHAAIGDHGGSIEVDRSPTLGGARFTITLRRSEAPA